MGGKQLGIGDYEQSTAKTRTHTEANVRAWQNYSSKTGERDPEMHQTKKGNQWYHRCAKRYAYGM